MTARNAASERQVQAARPDASTWLSANAGSGKTRVLTDRVARLLLDGTQPQHILCLTYTKAAAGEMQNRLFQRLGAWAMLDDAALRGALTDLGISGAITAERLHLARTLFARAIETPGGLKIQTIHSFCASLLRRFPLEAGVSPQFTEIEDRAAALLQAELVEDMAQGPARDLVLDIARHIGGSDLAGFTAGLVRMRAAFESEMPWSAICDVIGIPHDLSEDRIAAGVFTADTADLLSELARALASGSANDVKAAARLRQLGAPGFNALPDLESLFLFGAAAKAPHQAKLGQFPTKGTRGKIAHLLPALDDLMQRVEAGRNDRIALKTARKTDLMHRFARAFLPEYARRKELRGWLDFDDLIFRAQALLTDPRVAEWVLFRLDGGIDHILVDEAQDTSPVQWSVIEKLAQEFTSGQGARADRARTIFVVGDKKQSIYSFQGADPEAFDRMQAAFSDRLAAVGQGLTDLTLEYSFRSAESILRLVDLVFGAQAQPGFGKDSLHIAFREAMPGRVDLWPLVEPVETEDSRKWYEPLDQRSPQHHSVILARRIADRLRRMIDDGETVPDGDGGRRPLRAGDILILVQRRSDLFAEIIRACKAVNLPIAGADRLKVGAELAVRDLAAVLTFLATPEDDLALAVALRSPLFGWSEAQLFDLAHRRDGAYLWQALRAAGPDHAEALTVLNDLRDRIDFLRPYDLIDRILTRHDGRKRLLGRLGREAEDGINALLAQALAYERSEVPSLTGFLVWMETDDLEVKRQIDNTGDMIRVMTVHGAKGLEAPVVILPDCAERKPPRDNDVLMLGDLPVWRGPATELPQVVKAARDDRAALQQQERMRLLYVALTRAEKWLIVAAAGTVKDDGDSWYRLVRDALSQAGAQTVAHPGGPGLRLSNGDWEAGVPVCAEADTGRAVTLSPFFGRAAAPPAAAPATLGPSDLGGAKALPGEAGQDEDAAKLRGTRLHLLLEHLPKLPHPDWPAAARALLGMDEAGDLLTEAQKVLEDPALAPFFAPGTLAEVSITADVGGHRMHGTIDRLRIADGSVLALDFKTNAVVPDGPDTCPEGLLRQMGAYAAMLEQVYPGHKPRVAILWTREARLMHLPHDMVTRALWRSPHLDAARRGS